jgi:hypothetical protein
MVKDLTRRVSVGASVGADRQRDNSGILCAAGHFNSEQARPVRNGPPLENIARKSRPRILLVRRLGKRAEHGKVEHGDCDAGAEHDSKDGLAHRASSSRIGQLKPQP